MTKSSSFYLDHIDHFFPKSYHSNSLITTSKRTSSHVQDVINILNLILKDLDGDNSLGSLIYTVRDLVSLSESNEYLQVCINELSKAKKQDQKHFENLGLAVIEDVHRAT